MPSTRPASPLLTAIDIGTNTLLAATGRVNVDGSLELVADRHTITRLGEGVDASRTLSAAAMERALEALRAFVEEARSLGTAAICAVATSAVRDALNRDEFLSRARRIAGPDVRVIDGDHEAKLTFRGAALATSIAAGSNVLAFDVGGGSTEIAFGRLGEDPRWHRSIDVGSVRLTERVVRADPPGEPTLSELRRIVEAALVDVPRPDRPFALVGLAATVTTLVALANEGALAFPAALERGAVSSLLHDLARTSLAGRRTMRGLDPRRADVIVAGAAIVDAMLEWSGAARLDVSPGGVRIGLLLERATRS